MFKNRVNKKQGKADVLSILVFVGLFFVLLVYSNLCSNIDCWIQDFWQKFRVGISRLENKSILKNIFPVRGYNKDIVLIIVDDKSILGVKGLFENDRNVYARGLRILKDLNPKTVGLDMLFTAPSTESQDNNLVEAVKAFNGKIVVKAFRNDDLTQTPPFAGLVRHSAPSYFKNIIDKAIRSISLVLNSTDGKVNLSFQTKLWANFKDIDLNDISFENGYLNVKNEKLVKLINSEFMLLNYDKPLRFRRFSFYDLYNKNIPASEIQNKLVIIGSGNSLTEELLYSPTSGDQFSPIMNALALSNLLEKGYLTPNNKIVTLSLTLLILVSLYFVFTFASPTLSLVVTFILNLVLIIVSLTLLMQYNIVFEIVCPIAAATLSFMFMIGRRYYVEYSEKKHIKSAFQHYVTASVVNEILKDPKKLNLHGEERNLTIFFSDIEGFTSLAEGMSPLDVVSLLNEYLTAMTDIIFEFNGLLDKYEGDAIMAVFGAPVDQSDHATRACRCALKNQKVLNQLRGKWHREGKPQMRVRIGINTGIVVVGNMGSTMRFDYTVIGDNVNLAARLEAANKIFSSSILVSEETALLAEKSVVSRKVARLKAIGKSVYTNVYELLSDKITDSSSEIDAAMKAKEAYEMADKLLNERDFQQAEKVLGVYLRDHENDMPAKLLYSKIKGFLLVPPPSDWENVVTQEEK
ncbi:MAG: adenylate/guanylate cyclase domain-containing protein [Candidatus Riflebacteria bacterium]|nr:adenylate/guanylate cyclase domain-containing protein [Candidatus Riflebacteria bacterium]